LLQTSEEKESTEPPTVKEETTKAPKKTGIFVEDEYLLGKLLKRPKLSTKENSV
jgi:hypothetical protein